MDEKLKSGLTLFDQWTLKGHWWDSALTAEEGQDLRVSGELSYHGLNSEAFLELMGSPEHLLHKPDPNGFIDLFGDNYQDGSWIHGLGSHGNLVTLAQTIVTGYRRSASNHLVASSTIGARWILLGVHATSTSTFCKLTLSFPGLSEFLKFAFDIDSLELPPQAESDEIEKSLEVRAKFGDEPVLLSFRHFSRSKERTKNNLESSITIEPYHRQDANWYFEITYSLQYFLSVLYGFPTCPNLITLGDDVSVWYQFSRGKIQQVPEWHQMIVRATPDTFVGAVKKWLNQEEAYKEATYRFFGSFFFPHPKANVNLVFYSQTMEVLHELLLQSSKNWLSKSQSSKLRIIKQWIKRYCQDKKLSDEIIEKLGRVGSPSQKDRLTELFETLNDYQPGLFYEDPTCFVKSVVNTRNYYIHGSKRQKNFLSLTEQYIAAIGLELAILLLLQKDMGLPASLIKHGLEHTPIWRRWIASRDEYLSEDHLLQKNS